MHVIIMMMMTTMMMIQKYSSVPFFSSICLFLIIVVFLLNSIKSLFLIDKSSNLTGVGLWFKAIYSQCYSTGAPVPLSVFAVKVSGPASEKVTGKVPV